MLTSFLYSIKYIQQKNYNMKKIVPFILITIVVHSISIAQQKATTSTGKKVLLSDNGTWIYADSILPTNANPIFQLKLEIPKTNPTDLLISHTGFSLCYNEQHKQANWVAYELTKEETITLYDRTNTFVPDPKVKVASANNKDYLTSGFDRGHLAPASDMSWSATAIVESFYYSNVSPQAPSFNRGIWKKLEEQIRAWAVENGSVYIVTGPVLTSDLQTIGTNKVAVPNYFYKVVLDYAEPIFKGIGFILPNDESSEPLQYFVASIDSVQKLTQLDFFPLLPDEQQDSIEKKICIECWSWKNIKTNAISNETKNYSIALCNGKTKAGNNCKNKALATSAYCKLHQAQQENRTGLEIKFQTTTCSAITKAGTRCKNKTTNANGRCYQHNKN